MLQILSAEFDGKERSALNFQAYSNHPNFWFSFSQNDLLNEPRSRQKFLMGEAVTAVKLTSEFLELFCKKSH